MAAARVGIRPSTAATQLKLFRCSTKLFTLTTTMRPKPYADKLIYADEKNTFKEGK